MILVVVAAAIMAAMALGEAGSAQAKEDAHCISDQVSFSECAGGNASEAVAAEVKCLLPLAAVPVPAVAAISGVPEVAAEEGIAALSLVRRSRASRVRMPRGKDLGIFLAQKSL